MQDRPTVVELIAAVRHFLEEEILPIQNDQRVRFRTRVAANALTIAQRELAAGGALIDREIERLQALLDQQDTIAETREEEGRRLRLALAQQIRAGAADHGPWRQRVFASALASVRAKLLVSNPKLIERDERGWAASLSSQLS